jgi:AraC-like DNA-binding protein
MIVTISWQIRLFQGYPKNTMDFIQQDISPYLKQYVSAIWASQGHQDVKKERIVPDGGSVLIFNFGDSVTATLSDGSTKTWKGNIFAGLMTSYIDLTYQGRFEQVGVIFKPFGAFHLIDCPMSEFSDSIVEPDLVDKHKFQAVFEEMGLTNCIRQRLSILGTWLEKIFAGRKIESFIPHVTSLLYDTEEVSVSELADTIGKSQQHIARSFNKYTGTSPKKLQRIFRFQKVLQTLSLQHSFPLTATAYQFNYFDQPHFNNEVRSFSGFTPSQIVKQNVMSNLRVIR